MARKKRKPRYVRNKSIDQYKQEIDAKEKDLLQTRKLLKELFQRMLVIEMEFREERKKILGHSTRRSKRPQKSKLTLQVWTQSSSGSPLAKWLRFVRMSKEVSEKKGQKFYTATIRHRRKLEYLPDDLARYAHADELTLVFETEAKLAVLRKRVLPLQESARKLSIGLTRLRQSLWKEELKRNAARAEAQRTAHAELTAARQGTTKSRQRRRSAADDRLSGDLFEQGMETPKPTRPQFRHPDGVL